MAAKPSAFLAVIFTFIVLADYKVFSLPSATYCRTCDTHDPTPQDDCYQTTGKKHKICTGGCITRFLMTSSGLRIQKGCTDDATCLAEWWLFSSVQPACQASKLSGPGATLPDHVTCSVCCHAFRDGNIYCSDDLHPPASTLIQYPDVPRPTAPPSVTVGGGDADTSFGLTSESPGMITQQSLINPEDAKKYPDHMVCANCEKIDQVDQSSCGASFVCYGSRPLCMTSFFDDGKQHLTEIKRCAAVSECWDLWYNETRLRPDCMGDIDHDPFSWESTKSGECHYCCHTPEGESSDWCNKAMWPTKPRNLVDMPDYQRRILDPKTTTVKVTTEKLTTEHTTEAQTMEESTTQRVTTDRDTTQQITTDGITTQQVTADKTTTQQITTDGITRQQMTDDYVTNTQTTDQDTTELATVAQTTDQDTTEHATDQDATELVTVAQTTENVTIAQTTEEVTVPKSTDQDTTEKVTFVQTTDQDTTEKVTFVQTTDKDTTEQVTVAQTTDQDTTEQVTFVQTTDQDTTEQMTVAQTTDQDTTEQVTVVQTTVKDTTEQATDLQTLSARFARLRVTTGLRARPGE
ncbi:hypothetical protein EGW08_008975 [Elysia chlorotica]|uniref:Sushi domain-containing protein n=1 Tax=Elysia chlorotica TaxID=188477 RepID=A0A3S1C572_ELYCH|nr:hypothetical protein EGW08_008975 [Elysia chlorotica]